MRLKILALVLSLAFIGCGTSSQTTHEGDTEGAVIVRTLVQIPTVSEVLTVSEESDTSIGAGKEVSGTPPYVVDIEESNIDQLFWNGLLGELADADEITSEEEARDFFMGLGSCRMISSFTVAFENMERNGNILCYLKKIPDYPDIIEVTDAPDGVTISNVFDQGSEDKTIRVDSNLGSVIYLKIFGADSDEGKDGYALDFWSCADDNVDEYKETRINSADRTMTEQSYNVNEEEGNEYTFDFIGYLTEDDSGNIVFDKEATHTVTSISANYMKKSKTETALLKNKLSIKNWHYVDEGDNGEYEDKVVSKSRYSGTSTEEVRFLYGSISGKNYYDNSPFEDSIEFQDDHYEMIGDEGLFYDEIIDYDFDGDTFFDGPVEISDNYYNKLETLDCNVAADVKVVLIEGADGYQELQEECDKSHWSADYCDENSSEIGPVMQLLQEYYQALSN